MKQTLLLIPFMWLIPFVGFCQIEQFGTKSLQSTGSGSPPYNLSRNILAVGVPDTSLPQASVMLHSEWTTVYVDSASNAKTIKNLENDIKRLNNDVALKLEIKRALEQSMKQKKSKKEKDEIDSLILEINILNSGNERLKKDLEKVLHGLKEKDSTILSQNRSIEERQKNYIFLYTTFLQEKWAKLKANFDTMAKSLSVLKPDLDGIRLADLVKLNEEGDFNSEDEAEALYSLRWRMGDRTAKNKKIADALTILEADLKRDHTETGLKGMEGKIDSLNVEANKSAVLIDDLKKFTAKYAKQLKKKKDENGEFQVGAQPDFLSNLGGTNVMNVIPAINIVGGYYYSKGENGLYASLRLFSGYTPSDTSGIRNGSNLWLPEASLFGITFDMAGVFIQAKKTDAKRLAVRFTPSFLIKNTPVRASDTTYSGEARGVGIIHLKMGLEYAPLKYLVLYGNLNYVTPITQVSTFEGYYRTTKRHYPFFDFGIRSPILVNDKKNNNTSINIDLNFIGISGDMKAIYSTKDVIIPSIRLGVVQQFTL